MFKNKIAPAVLVIVLALTVLSSALPVYAQTNESENGGGFFQGIGRLFSRFFNSNGQPKVAPPGMTPEQMPKLPMPSGSFQPMMPGVPENMLKEGSPSAQGNFLQMEERRLSGLVNAGRITEEQKKAILAQLKKIHDDLKSWAESQNIDPRLILPGPMTS